MYLKRIILARLYIFFHQHQMGVLKRKAVESNRNFVHRKLTNFDKIAY